MTKQAFGDKEEYLVRSPEGLQVKRLGIQLIGSCFSDQRDILSEWLTAVAFIFTVGAVAIGVTHKGVGDFLLRRSATEHCATALGEFAI